MLEQGLHNVACACLGPGLSAPLLSCMCTWGHNALLMSVGWRRDASTYVGWDRPLPKRAAVSGVSRTNGVLDVAVGWGGGCCMGAAGSVPGAAGSTGASGGLSSRCHPPLPAHPGLACCCYDCYGNNFNMFCSSEMLCLALFGWKAAWLVLEGGCICKNTSWYFFVVESRRFAAWF